MAEPFKKDLERDAMLLAASVVGQSIPPLVMQLPEFAGGPDRIAEYAKWISDPNKMEYRRKVAGLYLANQKRKRENG